MRAPKYYTAFRCLADACAHSCCVGWEIDVDEDTLSFYHSLGTPFGEEILRGIVQEDEGAHFVLCPNGKCPNLDARGLCRIISALGDSALCDICREHPRFYNEVAGDIEVGVGVACEAAARLVLSCDEYDEIIPIDEACEPSDVSFDARVPRAALYAQLRERNLPYEERRDKICRAYGFVWEAEVAFGRLSSLEYMEQAHRARLLQVVGRGREGADEIACERLFAYLVYRHASTATSEETFDAAVRMALFVEEVFARLMATGMDAVSAAILLSEEIEYSEENTAALTQ